MVRSEEKKSIVAKFFLLIFIISNFLVASAVLALPKKAEAQVPTNAFIALTVPVSDIPTVAERIFITIMRGVAYAAVEFFTSQFVNKITSKYKIRNYLYYDQVLSNYYLDRFLYDKVKDPDLRRIYRLMYQAYVTGEDTGLNGQPNRKLAPYSKIKQKIY